MSLSELYQEIIIDHGRKPRHLGTMSDANYSQVGHNPLCGDKLTLYVKGNPQKLEVLKFEGSGCAISMASASLMIEAVQGKSVEEVDKLFQHFHLLVTQGKEPEDEIGKLIAFNGIVAYPMRVKCATLAWHTLKSALANRQDIVSTEA